MREKESEQSELRTKLDEIEREMSGLVRRMQNAKEVVTDLRLESDSKQKAHAAAMALLNFPKARLMMTSASKIGRTLAKLLQEKKPVSEIHVCGVGIYCEWQEVLEPGLMLKKSGNDIIGELHLNLYGHTSDLYEVYHRDLIICKRRPGGSRGC